MSTTQADPLVSVAVWPDLTGFNKPTSVRKKWSEQIDWLKAPQAVKDKTQAQLIKLAVFGDTKTQNNSLRHDGNVMMCSGIVADYDGGQVSMAEAVTRLEKHGIKACVYPSWSYSPDKPRWRVLAPLSEFLVTSAHSALMGRMNGALGGILAAESWTLSQCYFWSQPAAAKFELLVTFDDPQEGSCIDLLDELDDIAIGKPGKAKNEPAKATAPASVPAVLQPSAPINLPAGLMRLIASDVEEGQRSDQFHRAVAWCKTEGLTHDAALALFEAHPNGVAQKYNGRLRGEFARSWGKADESAPTVAELPVMPLPPQADSVASDYVEPFDGPMSSMVDAMLHASPKPQPALAVLAAVAAMAAAVPSRYKLLGRSGLNLYCLGVAETGAGKDQPRTSAVAVAREAGAVILGKPGSGQGLEDALSTFPMLLEIDEIGHVLQAAHGFNAPAHLVALHEVLLRLFSSGSSTWHPRTLARKDKKDKPTRPIENPCLTLLGFTTPATLGRAVGSAEVESGLLGRILFAAAEDDVAPRLIESGFALPEDVKDVAGKLRRGMSREIHIRVSGELNILLKAERQAIYRRSKTANSVFGRALLARTYEKLQRLAGVLAVWDNPASPEITVGHVKWAKAYVNASDRAMVNYVENHMHSTETLANAAMVLKLMTRILRGDIQCDRGKEQEAVGKGWVPHSLLLRRCKLTQDMMKKATEHLLAANQIESMPMPYTSLAGRSYVPICYRPVGSDA